MNKKGQVESIIIGLVIIIVLGVAGIYSSSELLSEHRYVGDSSKNVSYDLAKCSVNIEESNLVVFENKQEAENGYQLSKCN